MDWLRKGLRSDALYEILVITWIVASPLAIARWVDRFEDPVSWAAFIAGVIGVLVGWLVVAPYYQHRPQKTTPAR
jgi:purine-cytosine permease-like protein